MLRLLDAPWFFPVLGNHEDEAMATALRNEDQRSQMLWSRRLRKEMARNKQASVAIKSHRYFDIVEPAIVPSVSITFVGHTVMHKPTLYRSHLFIDCGPFDSGGYLALLDVSAIMEAVK